MKSQDAPLLEITGLRKIFPGARALDWAPEDRLTVRAGEIHALAGENGAGKSTLIQVLGGIYRPDGGLMRLGGAPYAPTSVEDARRQGVDLVLQEPALIPALTVGENLYLGRERDFTRFGILWSASRDRKAADALRAAGLATDPRATVGALSIEERKLVELTRAMSGRPRVLVIDETTASLSLRGAQLLFEQLRALRDAGTAIVYISHYLEEIFELCDRVSVLKDGKLVGTWTIDEMSVDKLSRAMVGRDLAPVGARKRAERAPDGPDPEPILAVSGLTRRDAFRDVSLELCPGEILGIGGLVGCGSLELGQVIFGAIRADAGTVALRGEPLHARSPREAARKGIAYVPKERDEDGLILPFSVRDNVSLSVLDRLRRWGLVGPRKEDALVRDAVARYRVKAEGPGTLCLNLSGGNRQKVVLAKWFATGADVIVLNSPTRGIDVGAKAEIYQLMRELTASGVAILMITDELPELIAMSDRILIMRRGEVSGTFDRADRPSEEQLIRLMV